MVVSGNQVPSQVEQIINSGMRGHESLRLAN
jgi:hypothetical protein